ncbi:MAG: uroporphyrinogen-III synthase [Helicobacteraceae bacterium]|nr:uroporphyrinogen-III synthase [Candidatus Sulfurimonas ponti]MBL6973921.1 uroporphyrinogen-III synthase [Sulfurimonas sp.]
MLKNIYLFSTSSHPDAISINSLDITLLKPDIDFSQYDYFIITSKQVANALERYDKTILKPALCISEATALSYENIGGEVLYTGTGYGDDLCPIIKTYPQSARWLYLRAKVVASEFVSVCKEEGCDIDEVIMYESCCSQEIQNIQIKENATLIFTSPSSVKCFLQNNTIHEKTKVIVIGTSTAKVLPSNINYKISEKTSIESCIELI